MPPSSHIAGLSSWGFSGRALALVSNLVEILLEVREALNLGYEQFAKSGAPKALHCRPNRQAISPRISPSTGFAFPNFRRSFVSFVLPIVVVEVSEDRGSGDFLNLTHSPSPKEGYECGKSHAISGKRRITVCPAGAPRSEDVVYPGYCQTRGYPD